MAATAVDLVYLRNANMTTLPHRRASPVDILIFSLQKVTYNTTVINTVTVGTAVDET